MSKRNRIFLSIISSALLGVVALGLWGRLGPLGPSVNQALSDSSIAQQQEEDEMGDHPGEAREFRNLSLRDENGIIPPDGLIIADQQMDAMRMQQENSSQAITRAGWTWIGPGNIGGRVRSVVIHPADPNTIWAGSVTGGIWKTTNAGVSWALMDDFMSNMAVSTMVIDPTDPNVLYAGTGEGVVSPGWNPISEPRGAGVFKTTNGGTTWTQLPSTNTPDWYSVNRLAISPANHLILLAATETGMWKSTDGGTSWIQSVGTSYSDDVNFNPSDGTKAVVGGQYSGKAYYSTNSGDSWSAATFTSISGGAGRVEVAYAPSSPNIVYASVNINGGEVWKSTNGGATYSRVNTGASYFGSNNQGWYDNIIWVDPTNPNTLIVGGIDLYRSTNGGTSLTAISQWWSSPLSAHADQHWIIEKPGFNGTSNTTVYFGNDGGVYRADNVYTVMGTSGWTELNNNLGITQFYGAAGNPTTGKIIGGTQDNGTLVYSPAGGTEGWVTTSGGDGGWSAADPTDGNYLYGEYVYAKIHRSTSGGSADSSTYIFGGVNWNGPYKAAPYLITDARDSKANFIAPFILDPNNANRLLVGGQSLWRTNDVKAVNTTTTGPAWAVIKTPTAGNSNISAIVVAPGNSDIVWVGHNNGDVYKTVNGTATTPTWTKVDTGTPNLPNRYATRITIDKNDNNKVYVTFGGFSADNVYRTTDGGSTWSDITGTGLTGLPSLPVRSLVIDPNNSSSLYVGTELGIFTSADGGANWTLPHNGPTNTSVDELFWMGTKLVAVTYGRGLYTQDTVGGATTVTLSVTKSGSGTGTVTSSPAGIACGSTCSFAFNTGTMVTLTAVPDAGIPFGGWSGGGCSGTGTCVVTMSAAQSVTATFGTVTAATFTDVPASYWAYQYIERLYKAGVTTGCSASPLMYCPLTPVTRSQMAIFILRGKYGSAYTPPAASGRVFSDVSISTFGAAWIEQLFKEGITTGCGNSKYCPDDNVTRAQMAIFLLRGKYGSTYVPPVAIGVFPDVPVGSFAADWIEQLAKDNITSGCGGGLYCPSANVIRDQMAVFLVKAFSLP